MCVPTPLTATKDPDLAPVLAAAETIRGGIRAGQLVVLQSTTFPGTTTGPFREVVERSGLQAGVDFDLAFAPERVNPGDPASASKGVPRLVGATTPAATRRAAALLGHINDRVVEMSSPDAAELAKLLENVFRNINIAFANQLALLCERMGLDVWEVIDGAATKPFGFMRFTPGPGVGGHCIPVDPYYLSWRAREFDFIDRFIELAGDINFGMPRHVVDLVAEALNDRGRSVKAAKVGILGVAFKPNVRDARNSPAAEVLAGIAARGADVRYHDPHVPSFPMRTAPRVSTGLDELISWADAIVVVTAHADIDWARVYERADLVVDTVDSSTGARPAVGRSCDWGPDGRRGPDAARRHAGQRGRVLMIVHAYYEEDPRVRREAEAVVATGRPVVVLGAAAPGRPVDGELAGVRIRRLDVQRHQGAGFGSYLREYLEFFGRAMWAAVRAHRRERFAARPGPLVAGFPRVRRPAAAARRRAARAGPARGHARVLPDPLPGHGNPLVHRLLLLQERCRSPSRRRRSRSTRPWPIGSSASASRATSSRS